MGAGQLNPTRRFPTYTTAQLIEALDGRHGFCQRNLSPAAFARKFQEEQLAKAAQLCVQI
jgi:hypothetical protein